MFLSASLNGRFLSNFCRLVSKKCGEENDYVRSDSVFSPLLLLLCDACEAFLSALITFFFFFFRGFGSLCHVFFLQKKKKNPPSRKTIYAFTTGRKTQDERRFDIENFGCFPISFTAQAVEVQTCEESQQSNQTLLSVTCLGRVEPGRPCRKPNQFQIEP